jgi:hypothetical protein
VDDPIAAPVTNPAYQFALHQPCQELPDLDYPFHDKVVVVSNCGRICWGHER